MELIKASDDKRRRAAELFLTRWLSEIKKKKDSVEKMRGQTPKPSVPPPRELTFVEDRVDERSGTADSQKGHIVASGIEIREAGVLTSRFSLTNRPQAE